MVVRGEHGRRGAVGRSWDAVGALLGRSCDALGRLLDASWTQLGKNAKKKTRCAGTLGSQLGAPNPPKLAQNL